MRSIKLLGLLIVVLLATVKASGQANAYLNILTLNGGQVVVGGSVDIQVSVGNSGPNAIQAFKVRAQISVPGAIVTVLPNAQQTGLPTGWTVQSNTGSSIIICNGADVIPAGVQRQIFIKIQGIAIGGPSTINGTLLFSNGTNCNITGSLAGDNTSDNTGTTSIQVISAPTCSLTGVTASAGTITCHGDSTTFTATPTGITTGIEYSLNNGPFQTSNIFTVGAGIYTVTAREVSTPACSATAPAITITEPPAVAAPLINVITQPTCTVAAGSVELGGLPPGNWTINPGAIVGNTTTTTINNLTQGTYSFTVTNAAGCTSAPSANVVINAQPVTPSTPIAGTITQPTCAVSTGSIMLTGLPAGCWMINPGVIIGNTTSTTISGLNPGTYYFTVTNIDGCTSDATPGIVINDVPGAPSSPVTSVVHPTCTVATGMITITSAITGLTFSLDGAAYAPYPLGGYVVTSGLHELTAQNASSCISSIAHITVNAQPVTPAAPAVNVVQPTCSIATGTLLITSDTAGLLFSVDGGAFISYPSAGFIIATGSHTLAAKNASGCISPVTNVTVNAQPTPPVVSASAGTISCFGGTTTLTLNASGGTGILEYSLDGITYQAGNTFPVVAGSYTATVRDANLCTGTAVITIIQPAAIVATASTGAIACNGGTSSLTIATAGGVPPLQYSLNGGTFQAANSFVVAAGTYTVTVKDANGCTATTPVVTVTQPSTLTASATAKRIIQCGGTTEVTITATGGIAPYTSGVGSVIKGPGTWIFSVTDSGGCTDTTQITIEPPGCMDLKVYPNPTGGIITINHSTAQAGAIMQVFEINGALVYSKPVVENAFETTLNISGLASGVYVLLYINGNDKKAARFSKMPK